jgi:uncharacterized membrane protein YkvA (DUF1232 family)
MPTLRERASDLKRQALTVYYAARDPAMPWHVRVLAVLVAAYAFSPIDLIPDFIPVLGLLDDLLLIPAGVVLVAKLTPRPVWDAAKERARISAEKPVSRAAMVVIAALWVALLAGLAWWGWRRFG